MFYREFLHEERCRSQRKMSFVSMELFNNKSDRQQPFITCVAYIGTQTDIDCLTFAKVASIYKWHLMANYMLLSFNIKLS